MKNILFVFGLVLFVSCGGIMIKNPERKIDFVAKNEAEL